LSGILILAVGFNTLHNLITQLIEAKEIIKRMFQLIKKKVKDRKEKKKKIEKHGKRKKKHKVHQKKKKSEKKGKIYAFE
jgi:hypothetical protein